MGTLKKITSGGQNQSKSTQGTTKRSGSLVRISTGERIRYNPKPELSRPAVTSDQKEQAQSRYDSFVQREREKRETNTSTESAEEDDRPGLLERLGSAAKSVFSGAASNSASAWGTLFQNSGGTAMQDVYEDQLRSINLRIAAAEKQLREASADDPMRRYIQQDLDQLLSQKNTYEQSVRANREIGNTAVQAADEAARYAQKQQENAKQGLGKLGSAAVDVGTGIAQFGLEAAVTPFLPTVSVPASSAGATASTYRSLAGEEYDPKKALGSAALGLGGYLAGRGLSKAVGTAGLSVMRNAGVQNKILPNIITSGLSGVGFSAGMTGASELSKALADENYEPDWNQIGTDAVAAFAFGAIGSVIQIARSSRQNKAYVGQLNQEVQKRYSMVKQIMRSGSPEQKAQGAASVMDGVDRLRNALDNLQFVGAQKQVDSVKSFLNSIDAEMAQYLQNGAARPSGVISSTANAPVVPTSPVVPSAEGAAITPTPAVRPNPKAPAAAVSESPAATVPSLASSGIPSESNPVQRPQEPAEASSGEMRGKTEEEPVEEVFPPAYYEDIEREPAPEPETPDMTIPTGSAADLEPLAKTLGESGRKAMTAFYDSDIQASDYAEDFIKAYNSGRNGTDRPTPRYISEPIAVAAYFAGQNDAKAAAAAQNPQTARNTPAARLRGADALRNGLRAQNTVSENGFSFSVRYNPGSKSYFGTITREGSERLNGMVSDARSSVYTGSPMKTRAKSIEDLIAVAERNNLFAGSSSAPQSASARKSAGKAAPMPEAETGKPFTATLYHGSGADPSEIYTGVEYPVAGKGRYFAMTQNQAKAYGAQVDAEDITLKNPLVVRDDSEWRAVTQAAGWKYPNMFGSSEEDIIAAADAMRAYVLDSGHDGLVIQYDDAHRGDINIKTGGIVKTLDNVFGHDQVVVYQADEAGSAGAQAPLGTEDRMAAPSGSGRADQWTADRVGSRDKTPKSLSEIVEDIRYAFGLNITTGHIRGKETLGTYNQRSQGIRSKIHNDLPTISHELGHHLDNTYSLTKDAGRDAVKELIDHLSADMRNAYPQKKWGTEGLAEYVRQFLQNREVAAIDYPKFTEYFMGKLSGKDAASLDQLADEINAYYSLGADSAASSIRLREEREPDARTLPEKIRDKGDSLYQAWVDINHGIKLFDEAVGADTYKLATNAAYSDAMAANIILHELRDADGTYVGPGLSTVLHGINLRDKAEYKAFGEYLTVRHGPERLKEGMRVYADDRKNSSRWMQNRQHELEVQYPSFREVSDRLYDFQRQLLQTWGVNTGLVSAKSAEEWGKRWKFYVPFNRAMDDKQLRGGARRGFANQSSTIRRARGSGRDIIHPVDNIIANMVAMVNAGVRNNVMRRITDAAERSEDYAVFLEKVPVPLKQKKFDSKDLKKGLTESILDSGLSDVDKDLMVEIVANLDDILIQYGRGKAYGDVITVMKGGKQEFWKINDPLLLQSITNMSPGKLDGILDAYAVVSRFMTGNITGKNLLWSIFSNAPRDLMTFFTYSKDKNPLHVFGSMGAAYANKIKGDKADPLFMEYLAMGGGQTSAYTADRDLAKKARKKMAGRKWEYANPMEWIAFMSDMIEMGPRFATYKMMREKGMSPQDAFYEAMDITVNFRRGGKMAREVNKVVPFFNASVQGLDKFSRWIRATDVPPMQRTKVLKSRMISYLAASAALAATFYLLNNRDEEMEADYQQLSNFTKNSYWLIPLGDGKYFAIPKPRELGVLSSFFETAAEYLASENPHAFDGFYDYVTDNGLPPVLSELSQGDWQGAIGSLGLIGTGAYLMANRDFLGRPIESSGLSNLEPKDRYTSRTSQIAKAMGQAFNISPQKIDYFFNSVLGGFWKAQKALFPVGKENVDLTLGVQNTYIKDNQYSLDLMNWMYDQAERSAQASNSDPANMEKAIEKKMDANMTSFYSRYYALSKDQPDTVSHRSTRQTVLDMIREYQKAYDLNSTTRAQEAVYAICREKNSTDYLPGVMQTTVKDGNDVRHTLSDVQYVEFQTEYLGLYWEIAEDVLSDAGNAAERASLLKEAKDTAKEQATNRVLRRIGAPIVADYDYGTISPADVAEFNSIYSNAISDKDEDGDTIPGSKQEKVIAGIESIEGLTDEQRSLLFQSVYDSDKNNPWAAGSNKKYWWQ